VIALTLLVVLLLAGLLLASYLLGFRLGGQKLQDDLLRVRLEAIEAQRQLHRLTRDAFVAMAEHAEQTRR
jgi:hypothetical protein